MPTIRCTASIDVQAPARAVFDVITGDILKVVDEPAAMQKRKPLDKGPLRNGFRWCQTVIHNRHECRSDWVVTEFEPPVLLEQSLTHRCAEVSRELEGAERWEMFEKDGSTLITLSVWWVLPGVRGWLNKLAGTGQQSRGASVRRRLAYTQFEAERRSGVQS